MLGKMWSSYILEDTCTLISVKKNNCVIYDINR